MYVGSLRNYMPIQRRNTNSLRRPKFGPLLPLRSLSSSSPTKLRLQSQREIHLLIIQPNLLAIDGRNRNIRDSATTTITRGVEPRRKLVVVIISNRIGNASYVCYVLGSGLDPLEVLFTRFLLSCSSDRLGVRRCCCSVAVQYCFFAAGVAPMGRIDPYTWDLVESAPQPLSTHGTSKSLREYAHCNM